MNKGSRLDDSLSGVSLILQGMKELCDSVNIPILKGLAGLGVLIVGTTQVRNKSYQTSRTLRSHNEIQNVRSNQQDCIRLGLHIAEIIAAIIKQQGAGTAPLPGDVVENIEQLSTQVSYALTYHRMD